MRFLSNIYPRFAVDLVTFTEKNLNRKPHFLCIVSDYLWFSYSVIWGIFLSNFFKQGDVINNQLFVPSYTEELRKQCPYSELFCSAFFPHYPAFGLRISPHSVWIPENAGKMRTRVTENTDTFYAEKGIRNPVKNLRWSFLRNYLMAKSCYFFLKLPHLRCSTGFQILLWYVS